MKNKSFIFAAFLSGTKAAFISVALFFAISISVKAANTGYLSNGCCALGQAIVPDRTEKGSLSSFINFNFSFTSGTMKDYTGTNNSNVNVTSTHETGKTLYSDFLIEKNAKNRAYYFILSNDLLDRFAAFCKDYYSDDPHKDCVDYLISKI